MVVGCVTTKKKSRSTQSEVLNNNYTGLTTNTETPNTEKQPSDTIRRSIRRYISASDRPTGKERGGGKLDGAPAEREGREGVFAGARLNRNALARAAPACCSPGLGKGHSQRNKYFFLFHSFQLKGLKTTSLLC